MDNDQDFECVHCGEYNPALDHWETCSKHPARTVVELLSQRLEVANAALLGASGFVSHYNKGYADALHETASTGAKIVEWAPGRLNGKEYWTE